MFKNDSSKNRNFQQYRHSHLKNNDYQRIVEQSKADYERCLNERIEEEIRQKGLTKNGNRKPRTLHTPLGTIRLKIPKVAHGNYIPSFVVPNSPFDHNLLYAIQSMYLGGMSQQAITSHLNEVHNLEGVTRRQVQTAISKIIKPSLEFLGRDLSGTYYPAVYVDSHYTPIREGGKVRKQAVMVAIGRKADGSREVLGMDIQASEAASNYSMFFQQLKRRGLQPPEVVVSDEHRGLRLAVRMNFPLSCWRRCNFHVIKTAGALSGYDRSFVSALSESLLQESKASIITDTFQVLEEHRSAYPEAVKLVEESLVDLMNFYPSDGFPSMTATNNASESLNSLVRSRTDKVRVFPHSVAFKRLVGNLLLERSEGWKQKVELDKEKADEIARRKNWRQEEVEESLSAATHIFSSKVKAPCILWIDEIFQDVSISYVNISLGFLVAYACDLHTGKRWPVALQRILDSREEAVKELAGKLKESFDMRSLLLVVAPMMLEPCKEVLKEEFPQAMWQLDTSSFAERVANAVPKSGRKEAASDLKELFRSKSGEQFEQVSEIFVEKYSRQFPKAVKLFKDHVSETATCFKLNLPITRAGKIGSSFQALRNTVKAETMEATVPHMPHPNIKVYEKILLKVLGKESKAQRNRAYINLSKLFKHIK